MRFILAFALFAPATALAFAPQELENTPSPVFVRRPPDLKATPSALADPAALGAPILKIALDPILDNMRRTNAAFDAGGATVHVFGDKSQNKKSWFLGMAVAGGEAQFVKGEKIIHWMLIDRKADVVLNGRAYKVQVLGQLRNRMQSKIVFEPKDGSPKAIFTAQQISDAVYDAGWLLQFGGREFRLLYTRNFNETDKGAFGGYSGDRSIVLMFKQDGKFKAYHWFERAIPTGSDVLVSTPKTADEDDNSTAGAFSVGLRIHNRELELYYPVPAP